VCVYLSDIIIKYHVTGKFNYYFNLTVWCSIYQSLNQHPSLLILQNTIKLIEINHNLNNVIHRHLLNSHQILRLNGSCPILYAYYTHNHNMQQYLIILHFSHENFPNYSSYKGAYCYWLVSNLRIFPSSKFSNIR